MTRLVVIALALALGACKQGTGTSRARRPDGKSGDGASKAGTAAPTTSAIATEPPPPCGGIGTEWDGRPQGCAYEHEGCCYADAETACKVAACAPEHCTVLETYPAQIACDTPDEG